MLDSSHGSALSARVLDAARNGCANRDILSVRSRRTTSTPRPWAAAACSSTPNVARAAAALAWREWVERAGSSAPRAPMWTSRQAWLDGLRTWAQSDALAAVCGAEGVSITSTTLVAVAAVMAEHADHATGRNVAITRARIAERVGCDVRTVTTAWRVLRVAQWAVEAQRGHGSPTTPSVGRRPSVYHLVPCRTAEPVHDFHLPPPRRGRRLALVGNKSPSAHTTRAAKKNPSQNRRYRAEPRPLDVQRLAAGLVAGSHGLGQGHIGAVCDAITSAGIDPGVWSAKAITAALNADMKTRGWSWPDRVDRPGAFLASRLRRLEWRPEGPPQPRGVAADCLVEKPENQPLTAAQSARITRARLEIRAALDAAATRSRAKEHTASHATTTRCHSAALSSA